MSYDKLGEGRYLSEAERLLARVAREHGWSVVKTAEVTDNIWKEGFWVKEASVYTLTGPGDRAFIHTPLCAKEYVIRPGGRQWYSVSKRVIEESKAYESYVVLTFIKELEGIRVSDSRTAVVDDKTGTYSRYFVRYYGWYLDETVPLDDWLNDPSRLTGQERLEA